MNGRKIYTRRQWDNYYREWNEEKKRKLSQSCESSGFSGNGSSEHGCCEKGVDGNGKSSEFAEGIDVPGDGSTSTMLGKIVGEKARLSGSSSNADNFSFKEGLKRNKKKRRSAGSGTNDRGDYTELLIDSTDPHLDSAGKAVDKNMKGKEKEQRVSGSLLDEKNAYFDNEYTEFLDELEKNKKRRRNTDHGDYTELLIESENVVKEVENNKKGKVKEEIVTGANNVSSEDEDEDEDETLTAGEEEIETDADNVNSEDEDEDGDETLTVGEEGIETDDDNVSSKGEDEDEDETFTIGEEEIETDDDNVSSEGKDEDEDETLTAGEEEFTLQSILSEKTDNRVEESSKKVEEKAVSVDNFSTDSGESRGSPLSEKHSDYDEDYLEFLEEYLAVPPSCKEKSENGVERNNEAVDDIKCGSDVGDASEKKDNDNCSESFALSSDSTDKLEKWAEKKMKMNKKGKRKEKLEITGDNVSPKVEGLDNVNIKDGPAYQLRSRSVSKCEMKEKDPVNVRNPLPASKEDWGSETSSDEDKKDDCRMRNHVNKEKSHEDKKDDCRMRNHVNKDKKNVEHPSKRTKLKHGLGELNFKKILLNSISKNVDIPKNNLQFCNENIPGQLPLKFRFEDEDPTPPEKMEWEKELDSLFADLQTGLQEVKDSLTTTQPSVNEDNVSAEKHDDSDVCCQKGNHLLILDEQIGLICKYCSFVRLEMKYILPEFANKTGRRQGMRFYDDLHCPLNGDNLPLDGTAGNHCTSIHGGTTVWDILPRETKGTMYPHQREGFEFLWRNIGGDIHIENLKKLQSDCGKGCIISHAPGTGKTRLTIVFLQSFMKLFPDSHPVIIAPRSMLLTWEDEFRKWDVDVPFHNVNNPVLSGRENSISHTFRNEFKSTESKRMLKVYSWAEGSGILGITYRLFEQYVRVKENKEDDMLRKILLRVPGLVVLDEGHTPRNDDSLIWKALSKLETPRRIILSGTPFQNNFDELYNTLCLVSPKLSNFSSGSQLKKMRRTKAAKKKWDRLTSSIGKNKNDDIKELKRIIAPLVHVHNGSVLQERLPGIRSTLVYLKPTSLQKKLFSAMPQKKFFEEDHFMTQISVHPSLAKDIPDFSEYSREMEKLELNPDAGVKTEFLFALIRLSVSHGEKVIVFSQYIAPMELIKKQLKSVFDWVEGREVLHMDGEIDVHHRQASINTLNDPKSEVKVLLASTRACSEGINLVGASRVVLLDVVWNPSVKRQAISRAYRLGQKKIVHVYHLISSTMEARKYACQVKKDFISELVFSTSDGLLCKSGLPVSEDKILEAMILHPKHRHIFDRLGHDPKELDLIDTFDFVE